MSLRERRSPVKVAFYRRNPGICDPPEERRGSPLIWWKFDGDRIKSFEREIKRVGIRVIGLIVLGPSIVQPFNHIRSFERRRVKIHPSIPDPSGYRRCSNRLVFQSPSPFSTKINRFLFAWNGNIGEIEFIETKMRFLERPNLLGTEGMLRWLFEGIRTVSKGLLSTIETRLGDTDIPCFSCVEPLDPIATRDRLSSNYAQTGCGACPQCRWRTPFHLSPTSLFPFVVVVLLLDAASSPRWLSLPPPPLPSFLCTCARSNDQRFDTRPLLLACTPWQHGSLAQRRLTSCGRVERGREF